MIVEISGWLTAVILVSAGTIQLTKIIRTGKATGISPVAWFLYSIASIGAYIFAEKYISWQALFSFLVPGALNLTIAILASIYNQRRKE